MKKVFMFLIVIATMLFSAVLAQAGPLEDRVSALETTVAQLNAQLAAVLSNPAVQMGTLGYLRLDTNELNGVVGPHAIFEGINLHIRNGSGATRWTGTGYGLGNLIIGYNEVPGIGYGLLQPGDRSGYHNLIIGVENKYLANANSGIVQGEGSTIGNTNAAAVGGDGHVVMGDSASAFGGSHNTASDSSSVALGGDYNTASRQYSVVIGGRNNNASGYASSVTGGENNTASGSFSSVGGGIDRQASGDHDWAAGSLWENY